MREMFRGDGCVDLYDDADYDGKFPTCVEPTATAFTPYGLRCKCGAPLRRWNLRSIAPDTVELDCTSCGTIAAVIRLAVRTR
jgi:hypothetical protein